MSGDPSGALANAAAEIASLQAQIAQRDHDLAAARAQAASAGAAVDGANARAAAAENARAAAERVDAARIAELQDHVDTAQQAMTAARASRDALAAKFEAMYGDPVEDGIARGPAPYVTMTDGAAHPTLADARLHLIAVTAGLSTQQARELVGKQDAVIPLLRRMTPVA
jgi:hypothetical protein